MYNLGSLLLEWRNAKYGRHIQWCFSDGFGDDRVTISYKTGVFRKIRHEFTVAGATMTDAEHMALLTIAVRGL